MSCSTSPRPPSVFIVSSMELIICEAVCIFPTVCESFARLMETQFSHIGTAHLSASQYEFQWVYTALHRRSVVTHSLLCVEFS